MECIHNKPWCWKLTLNQKQINQSFHQTIFSCFLFVVHDNVPVAEVISHSLHAVFYLHEQGTQALPFTASDTGLPHCRLSQSAPRIYFEQLSWRKKKNKSNESLLCFKGIMIDWKVRQHSEQRFQQRLVHSVSLTFTVNKEVQSFNCSALD